MKRSIVLWYDSCGRHELTWRKTRNKWTILVSEVMLQQTPVARVEKVFAPFMEKFSTPEVMATSSLSDVIRAWDRLGYPRRARNLYAASCMITRDGWPARDSFEILPGVGNYTAAALRALTSRSKSVDNENFATDVNITRVCNRVSGSTTASRAQQFEIYAKITRTMSARDALLGVMDLGAMVCTKVAPECSACPLKSCCVAQGVLPGETKSRQKPYEGSFRQKRGDLLAQLRVGPISLKGTDLKVVASLLEEGFIQTTRSRVFLAEAL